MNKLTLLITAVLLAAATVGPAHAHHGAGVYDREQLVTLTGAVTQFHFVNPHVLIYISVEREDGGTIEWSGELTSPNRLARMGSGDVRWHKNILVPGDVITLTGHPARNGAPALLLNRVEAADGTVLVDGGR